MVTVAPTSPFDVPVFLGGALGARGYLADHVTTCTPYLCTSPYLSVWRCRLCSEPTFLRYIQILLLFN